MQNSVKAMPLFNQFPKIHVSNRPLCRLAAYFSVRGHYTEREEKGLYALRVWRGQSLLPEPGERLGGQRPGAGEKKSDRDIVKKKENSRLVEIEKDEPRTMEKVIDHSALGKSAASVKGGEEPKDRNEKRGAFPGFSLGGQAPDRRGKVRAGMDGEEEKPPVRQQKVRFASRRGQSGNLNEGVEMF